jgi:hypothetical protein
VPSWAQAHVVLEQVKAHQIRKGENVLVTVFVELLNVLNAKRSISFDRVNMFA